MPCSVLSTTSHWLLCPLAASSGNTLGDFKKDQLHSVLWGEKNVGMMSEGRLAVLGMHV